MGTNTHSFAVFISSSYYDLVEYRESVHAAIRKLRNHADDMIFWSADERSAAIVSSENVRHADLMILILAHKYGSIVANETRSFTHVEYDTARQANVPVLAFFLDPLFPWPPPHVEVDPGYRECLDRLKRRVEAECVRQFFTTPESLAMLVTQAIANFDKRVREPTVGPTSPGRPILLVKPRTNLANQPDSLVRIREAEDGLPLVIDVRRKQELHRALEKLANLLERDIKDNPLDAVERVLLEEGRKVWRNRGIHEVHMPTGQGCPCYVSHGSLSSLFSPSLLTTVLPLPNKPIGRSAYRSRDDDATILTSEVSREGFDPRVQSLGGRNRFLAIAIESDDVFTVGWDNKRRRFLDAPVYWRPFISESLFGFSECGAAISAHDEHAKTSQTIARIGLLEYADTLSRLMEANPQPDRVTFRPQFYVARRCVVGVILAIGRQLQKCHQSGMVHGDLKPQNVLLAQDGPLLIDSLSLKLGEFAPAVSPGWAAPEQILLQPVCEATDVFPLGIMLTSLVSGKLTGELAQYVVPSEGHQDDTISFFKNPRVYLDPSSTCVPRRSRVSWLDFIERCLRFDPEERPPSAAAFMTELEDLVADKPIEGRVEFELGKRGIPLWARLPDGSEAACRVVPDDWEQFYKHSRWRTGGMRKLAAITQTIACLRIAPSYMLFRPVRTVVADPELFLVPHQSGVAGVAAAGGGRENRGQGSGNLG